MEKQEEIKLLQMPITDYQAFIELCDFKFQTKINLEYKNQVLKLHSGNSIKI